ncbi:MAG: hypothetical protein L6Q35_00560 [Phycisphaerales bacterium]|nr:hypothetical protein [Phycisphaerales bacterium]
MSRARSYTPAPPTPGLAERRDAVNEDRRFAVHRFAAGQAVDAKCPYTQVWRPAKVVEPRDGWCRIDVAGSIENVTNERLRPRKGS